MMPVDSESTSDLEPPGNARSLHGAFIHKALHAVGLSLELLAEIDSTNKVLAGAGHRHRHFVLAEHQTSGRGRRGRVWISPPHSGLCLSFGYRFRCPMSALGPLGLAMGIVVAEVLNEQVGHMAIKLKWPNDLLFNGKKLGGLLVEAQPIGSSAVNAVVGLGLNVCLPLRVFGSEAALADAAEGRGWTDLQAASEQPLDRSQLAVQLAMALDRACNEFERNEFSAFIARWSALDALCRQRVIVQQDNGSQQTGVAAGIRSDGALWLDTPDGRVALQYGEVSIRRG